MIPKTCVWIVVALLLVGCGVPTAPTEPPPTPTLPPADTATPAASPTSTAAPTPDIPEPERPLLMAHYMPWYQTPSVSGTWGWHWTMDHYSPSRVDETGRRQIASYTYPLTGPYDSSDDALLEYQVLLMHLSGIDGVIVDWYGAERFWDYATLNESTGKLFSIVERAGLRFAICYEDQTVKHMVDNKHIPLGDVYAHGQDVMRYLHETWFRQDAYLKVLDRPVLFVFGPQYFVNAADWDKLFAVLDTRPALITLDGHTESAGLSSYPWPPMWASQGGVLSQEALENYLSTFYRKAARWDYMVAGAFPGFQDIYQEAGVSSEARYLDPRDGETFRLTLQRALEQGADVIQLITWNDYGESTSIEPTEEFGYRYLEMVQETRREIDRSGFSYTADDLRLPLQLFELRNQYAQDADVQARLDGVFDAVLAGDLDTARAILAEHPPEG
ncbi:MAG: hypothetical protein JXA09_07670 [Anaerolineae bacterium]|nr:hypothetical protein [Anaerolineae bacterium]